MGCNCSKNKDRVQPLGAGTTKSTPRPGRQAEIREGARKAEQQSFELKDNTGKTQTFARRLDARAAQRRLGGELRPL